MISAGHLDKRITLQRASVTTNSLNEEVLNWSSLALNLTVPAEVSYRKASESIDGQQVVSTLQTRFVIRYSSQVSGITSKDRIVYNGKTYDISGIYPLGRNEELEIHATARAD